MKTQAGYVPRFTIVKHKGKLYMIETKSKPILLIPASGGIGIELASRDMEIEVVKYPAQLATEYLDAQN